MSDHAEEPTVIADGAFSLRSLPAEAQELARNILAVRVQPGAALEAADLSDEIRQATGVRVNYQSIYDWSRRHVPGAKVSMRARREDQPLVEDEEDILEAEQRRLLDIKRTRELKDSLREAAKVEQYKRVIADNLRPFNPSPLIPIQKAAGAPVHKWILMLSDWHVGQETPQQDTGLPFEQNYEITKRQVDKLLGALASIHEVEAHGQTIEELTVLVCGDIVEGDSMRKAQIRHSEFPVTEQTVLAFDLLSFFLRQLLTFPGIRKIDVRVVGGNHDRTSQKPGLAGLGETDYIDTFAWLIGEFLVRVFEQEPRLRVLNHRTFYGRAIVAGRRVVYEHGASIKFSVGSYGGIPFYGIVNAARGYSQMLDGADIVAIGHLHQLGMLPLGTGGSILLNGALPATTQYVQSSYKQLRTPSQWLIDLHDEHGVVDYRPLYAPINMPKEGEAWDITAREQADLWTPA